MIYPIPLLRSLAALAVFSSIFHPLEAVEPTAPIVIEAVGEKETAWKPRETFPLSAWPGAAEIRPDEGFTIFGGLASRRHKATGFFRVEKSDGRWRLLDPEGCEFFQVAVSSVRPLEGHAATDRLEEKFGSEEKWACEANALLRANAFNSTGAWSSDMLLSNCPARPVYVKIWNFMFEFGKRHAGAKMGNGHMDYPNKCVPVFHPLFEAFCEEMARELATVKDDPWLLGHYSDNELTFVRGSLVKFLELPEGDPNRVAAEEWLRKKHGDGATAAVVTEQDEEDFLAVVVERYFRIVSAAIRKNDPNHLFLGARFYGPDRRKNIIFRTAGPFLDVVSMNWYNTWTPQDETLDAWAGESGRPILVTEFYAKGADSGLGNESGAGFLVHTQRDRGLFYQNFTLALLRNKNCIGWTWFRYADNDPKGVGEDRSNKDSNKGIVTAEYEPYTDLLDLMQKVNCRVHGLAEHFDQKKPPAVK
jgi:hypothetical protein